MSSAKEFNAEQGLRAHLPHDSRVRELLWELSEV